MERVEASAFWNKPIVELVVGGGEFRPWQCVACAEVNPPLGIDCEINEHQQPCFGIDEPPGSVRETCFYTDLVGVVARSQAVALCR